MDNFQIHNENNEDNNLALSPYGALGMLIVLGEGLQGEALHEIQHAAHLPTDLSVVRVGLRDIHRHLKVRIFLLYCIFSDMFQSNPCVFLIISETISPIATTLGSMCPFGGNGNTEASATLSCSTPKAFNSGLTTAPDLELLPI